MTKLSLNLTYPALVALIGGDTEAEANIRRQVLERFATNHLKPLVNDQLFREAYDALLTGLRQEIAKQIGTYKGSWSSRTIDLHPDVQQALTEKCKNLLKDSIDVGIRDALKALDADLESKVSAMVEKRMAYYTKIRVDEIVKAKVDEALKAINPTV